MKTENETEFNATQELIRSVASGLIDRPDSLRVEYQASSNGAFCYWAMKGAPEDEPKLIGAGGSHFEAMFWLVAELGRAAGRRYSFRLITENQNLPVNRTPRIALQHDPSKATDLLTEILQALNLDTFAIEVGPGIRPRNMLAFTFTIWVRTDRDYSELLEIRSYEIGNEARVIGLNVAGALGTLFRGIGRLQGVRYTIAVRLHGA